MTRSRPGTAARRWPQVLADLGVFDVDRVLAAHGVWLTQKDVALLADHGVAVAHCPSSNAKLASGTARGAGAAPGRRPGRARHRRPGQQQRPRPLGGDAAGRALRPDAGAGPDRAAGGRGARPGHRRRRRRARPARPRRPRARPVGRHRPARPGPTPASSRCCPTTTWPRTRCGRCPGPRSGTSGSAAGRWSGTASASRSTWPRQAAGCRPRRPGWRGDGARPTRSGPGSSRNWSTPAGRSSAPAWCSPPAATCPRASRAARSPR